LHHCAGGLWLQGHIECVSLLCSVGKIFHCEHHLSAGSRNLTEAQENPPDIRQIPRQYEYLRVYAQEMAYVTPRELIDGRRTYTKRIYDTLRLMSANTAPTREIRMEHLYPGQDWSKVWKNIAKARITDEARSAWYSGFHDLIPTNFRLHNIRMADNEDCTLCGRRDNLTHRLTECGEGKSI
jgi:hypothetical protein